MAYGDLLKALKGGTGSGNFGHAGIPGKRGGSAPMGFSSADPQDLNQYYDLKSKCGKQIDCEALNLYTHSGYDVVNKLLRHGSYADSIYASEWKDKEIRSLLEGLDRSFQNAPTTPKNLKVYRGIGADVFEKLSVGDTFVDKGFVSTSIDPSQTMSGFKLEIRIPKGTKGIYIEQVSQIGAEQELLLNRGSRFRVLEINKSTNKFGNVVGNAILEVENAF